MWHTANVCGRLCTFGCQQAGIHCSTTQPKLTALTWKMYTWPGFRPWMTYWDNVGGTSWISTMSLLQSDDLWHPAIGGRVWRPDGQGFAINAGNKDCHGQWSSQTQSLSFMYIYIYLSSYLSIYPSITKAGQGTRCGGSGRSTLAPRRREDAATG